MKILLIIVGALLGLVLAVVVVGAILPKRHVVSRSASYRATPEQLFSLIAGPQTWRPDVVSSEVVQDADGRELLREATRNGDTMTYEVFDKHPPISISRRIAVKDLPYSGSWTYALVPAAGRTTVRITEDGEIYNPAFRFMSRFVLGQTSTMDAYLRALGQATGEQIEIQN